MDDKILELDKVIRASEGSLRIADRLKAEGRWRPKWDNELGHLRATLDHALRERNWLDWAVARYGSSR